MRTRLFLLASLFAVALPHAARAEGSPRGTGLFIRIDAGQARWNLDGAHIQSQPGVPPGDVGPALVSQTPNAPALTLNVGYTILDHASISAALTGTGWDVGNNGRGGAGFFTGEAAWHPLQLIPALRDRRYELQLFFGAGYGVVGEQRALDGLHLALGARAEFFVTRWFSVGASLRHQPLRYGRYVLDWSNDVSVPLPQGSGGSVLIPALTLAVHASPAGG